MKLKKVIFGFSMLTSVGAYADELGNLNNQQLLMEKHLQLQAMELNSPPAIKSVSTTCLTAPLPSAPKTPNYSLSEKKFDGSELKLSFWRETCKDGAGSALLVRTVPVKGNPFLCGPELKIIQNAVQFNNISLRSTPLSSGWCDNLFVPTTLIVDVTADSGGVPFNPAKGLTVFYNSIKLGIPVGGTPVPNISGSAAGYKSYKFTCANARTGEVKSFPLQTGTNWNCKGLVIKSGDTVKTTIIGIAK